MPPSGIPLPGGGGEPGSNPYSSSVASSHKILVVGATGYVGGRLVLRLLEAGHEVRVVARSPARASEYSWSDSVELLVFTFCFREKLITAPLPNVIPAPVCPLQSQWTP